MGMTIPTIPSLPAGYVVTETDLANLSAAATFAINKPAAFIYDGTGGQAITTSFAAVTFTAAQFQTDTLMFQGGSPKRCYVQTPGWYKVCYSVNVGTVGGVFNTAVRSTTGANNPQGSGVNSNYYWAGYTDVSAGQVGYAGAEGDWPFYMYQGDFFQVFVQAAAAGASTGITGIGGATGILGSYIMVELVSI